MPAQRYRIDVDTGLVHLRDQYGESEGVPLEAVTMGRLGITNGYLIAHSRGFAPRRIGTASESSVNVYDSGEVEFISGIRPRELEGSYTTSSQFILAGEVTVLTRSGEERTITIDRAPATKLGRTVLVRTNADNILEFYDSKTKFTSQAAIDRLVPGGWRFATAEEITTRGVIGYLKNNSIGRLQAILDAGGINSAEGPITDMSGLIRHLAKFGAADLEIKSVTQYGDVPIKEMDE